MRFFGPRAIPGVESVAHGSIRRGLRADGAAGLIEIRMNAAGNALDLELIGPKDFLDASAAVLAAARRVLDLNFQPAEVERCFAGDPLLKSLAERWPGVRLPGAWDGFEMGVRAILGQQVSVKAAHTLAGRLAGKYGIPYSSPWPEVNRLFPEARAVAALDIDDLAQLGLTRKRAETISHFARWWDEDANSRRPMLDLPGIGPWTESYMRMRGGSEANSFPAGDLGIHKALGVKDLGPIRAAKAAEARSLSWRPWRAYAVLLLWRSLSEDVE